MYVNTFPPTETQPKLLIRVSSGYPLAIFPIVGSDAEQQELCRQVRVAVLSGDLLHALEGLQK